MAKISFIVVYNTIHKYNVKGFSETYSNYSAATDYKDHFTRYWDLIYSDHPSSYNKDDICIYYKESLAICLAEIDYVSKCLFCEVTFANKKG